MGQSHSTHAASTNPVFQLCSTDLISPLLPIQGYIVFQVSVPCLWTWFSAMLLNESNKPYHVFPTVNIEEITVFMATSTILLQHQTRRIECQNDSFSGQTKCQNDRHSWVVLSVLNSWALFVFFIAGYRVIEEGHKKGQGSVLVTCFDFPCLLPGDKIDGVNKCY